MTTKLDDLLGTKVSKKGCRICGYPDTRAVITVQLRKLNPDTHSLGGAGPSLTRSSSLCESCAVDLWQKLMGLVP